MTGFAIRLAQVRRFYASHAAVADVTLSAPAGKVTALLGASGSGKSTLLRLIAGLEPVDAGEIRFGADLVSAPGRMLAPEKRGVGFVFQDYALFPHMTALANVSFGLARGGEDIARAWLIRVGLGAKSSAYPHMLSGGEQQRVALARALASGPRIVLLDEPFSGLDPALRTSLRDDTLAAIAASGATAVFVTHDAEEALYVSDHLVILQAGRVVQAGAPRAVYAKPESAAAAAALGPINMLEGVVESGAVATPFGAVAAPGLADGARATVIVRAEAVRLAPGAGALIRSRRAQGAFDLVAVEAQGLLWRALAPPDGPAAGDTAAVTLDPAGAHVVAR
jgi:iron(III) transport system ATP-binding protein